MQVFQTPGEPPTSGRSIFPMSGCTRNNSAAPTKSVTAYRTGSNRDLHLGGAGIQSRRDQ